MNAQLDSYCDVLIAGGGLSGLALASLLAIRGVNVLVLEKENYPRHRVCGEYIAAESLPFLQRIGFEPKSFSSSWITFFEVVFPEGSTHRCKLAEGGFGLSRYVLDDALYRLALKNGARVITNTSVYGISDVNNGNSLCHVNTSSGQFRCRFPVAAAGRSVSGLLSKRQSGGMSKRFFGLKYHVRMNFPEDLIRIALFDGGYCGMSKIEDDLFCFCYLADAAKLKIYRNDIHEFERGVLGQNPVLRQVMDQMEKVNGPVTTANFQFGYRYTTDVPWLLTGDAAGFIPPLTGNGMSLAFRSAAMLGNLLHCALEENWEEKRLHLEYEQYGSSYLRRRIEKGNFLQGLILKRSPLQTRLLSAGLSAFPFLLPILARQAIGKTF